MKVHVASSRGAVGGAEELPVGRGRRAGARVDAEAILTATAKAQLSDAWRDLTDDERKAWQTAMQPTYKWAKGRVGQEVLDLVAKELDVKMN